MNTKSKNLKSIFIALLFVSIIVLTGFLMTACGGAEKDVTKLEGIVDQVGETTNSETGDYTGLNIIFTTDPTEFSATYKDAEINYERVVIEDYNGDGSNVNAYNYLFTFDAISAEDYNADPIRVNCTINDQEYEFDLTTNLLSRIYPDLFPQVEA